MPDSDCSWVVQQLLFVCLTEKGGGQGKWVSLHSIRRPFNEISGKFWITFSALSLRVKHQKSVLILCQVTEYGSVKLFGEDVISFTPGGSGRCAYR